jgi:hypothetical protein
MRDGKIDRVAGAPEGDHIAEPEQDHCQGIGPLGALGTVAQGANYDDEKKSDIQLQIFVS